MEGLIDLLITIMLLLFNALKDWPPWNAAFVCAEAIVAQILQPRTAAPGVATPLLEKECASVPFPVSGAEPSLQAHLMNAACCHLSTACLIPARFVIDLHAE